VVSKIAPIDARRNTAQSLFPVGVVVSLDGLPLMLTIGEAAQVLRVSRTTAYKLAEEWRATGGKAGLPTVKLGGRLLVRRVDLAAIVGLDAVG